MIKWERETRTVNKPFDPTRMVTWQTKPKRQYETPTIRLREFFGDIDAQVVIRSRHYTFRNRLVTWWFNRLEDKYNDETYNPAKDCGAVFGDVYICAKPRGHKRTGHGDCEQCTDETACERHLRAGDLMGEYYGRD